ncbi:MAG: flavin reductase, partial [Collinsella sp.]|nr:flavin reductase [Collinsella sp.]
MDKTAFFTMPSGLYVVSAAADGLRAGCVINTAVQVTSAPPRISIAVNKENVTSGVIASAKAFALTVIDQTADMLYIGNFGFRTSSNYDKFAKYETRETALGMPYVPEHAAALFSCRLIDTVDVGTHLLFIGEVEDAE